MSKPTKKQVMQSNAESFEQLLDELKSRYKFIDDFYYSDHIGVWCVRYKVVDESGSIDDEFVTLWDA